MDRMARPPADFFEGTPLHVRAYVDQLRAHLDALEARLAEREATTCKDSTNSSKPPSTEHPHAKPAKDRPRSQRLPGAQPGHAKHDRPLLPPEPCQLVVPCVPAACRRCGAALTGTDSEPLRHQVWEWPEIRPHVTAYRRHRLTCRCGCSTCGDLPEGVPTGQAGPRLVAFRALLLSCFRQSKRRAATFLGLLFHQPASAGWLVSLQQRAAEAVQPADDERAARLPAEPVRHADESPSKEGKLQSWVWTFVAGAFTVFACRTSRAADVAKDLLGADYAGVVPCERARRYWAFGRRQGCWAHLKRDFQGLIDSPCTVKKRRGHDLLRETRKRFALWQKGRDGTLARAEFHQEMKPLRARVESLLLRGYFNARTRGCCRERFDYRERLWVFVEGEGVEPTNNAAEQALRQAVIWRKRSCGTKSALGSRFVERLLTVIETCRRQERDAFAWLVEAVQAHFAHRQGPSHLPEA